MNATFVTLDPFVIGSDSRFASIRAKTFCSLLPFNIHNFRYEYFRYSPQYDFIIFCLCLWYNVENYKIRQEGFVNEGEKVSG